MISVVLLYCQELIHPRQSFIFEPSVPPFLQDSLEESCLNWMMLAHTLISDPEKSPLVVSCITCAPETTTFPTEVKKERLLPLILENPKLRLVGLVVKWNSLKSMSSCTKIIPAAKSLNTLCYVEINRAC